jgi:hypothetical protein
MATAKKLGLGRLPTCLNKPDFAAPHFGRKWHKASFRGDAANSRFQRTPKSAKGGAGANAGPVPSNK